MERVSNSKLSAADNFKLGIQLADGTAQTVNYSSRNEAQIDIDSKYVFRLITSQEWDRLTKILSNINLEREK